jgi:Zn-dependent protease
MKFRKFQIARLFEISVFADYTWLPVVALHIWLASSFYLPRQTGFHGSRIEYYAAGVLMTTLLFGSIIAHELAHALMAKAEGLRVLDIELHVFGGWTRLETEPRTPLAELRIAVAGPSMSFLVGLFFFVLLFLAGFLESSIWKFLLVEIFRYLFLGNFVLAMFNLLPGLPLDGGRAMRAWLWHRSGNVEEASRVARKLGIAISYMLSSFGIFSAVWWGEYLTGIWMLVVGFFIRNVAEGDRRASGRTVSRHSTAAAERAVEHWRRPGTVGAVMSFPAIAVLPDFRVSSFVDEILTRHKHSTFPVAVDGRLHGVVDLRKLRELPREEWDGRMMRDVMEPVNEDLFVGVHASLDHAARKLKASPTRHLAVLDPDGVLIGYLSNSDLRIG